MIGSVPEGPAWAMAMFLAVLVKDMVHALINKRRGRNGNGNGKTAERLATLEAQPILGERVASLETALKSLDGGGAKEVAIQLTRIEAQVAENTREILRIRDLNHLKLQPQMISMSEKIHEIERRLEEAR